MNRLFFALRFTLILVIFNLFFLSCGSDGPKDIPGYAIGKSPYFTAYPQGTTTFVGQVEAVIRSVNVNGFTSKGRPYKGYECMLDGQPVTLIYSGDMYIPRFVENKHILTARIEKNEKGASISKDFYFYNSDKFNEAIDYLKSLQKTENKESRFKGDLRTYHARIGKYVEYLGYENAESKPFFSLYLDCGAVVQIFDRRVISDSKIEGRTIDCQIDAANDVLEYYIE